MQGSKMSSRALLLSSLAISIPLVLILLIFARIDRWCSPAANVAVLPPFAAEEEDGAIGVTEADVLWVRAQLSRAQTGDPPKTAEEWSQLRKGINPRTREEQLHDLRRYHGISHYEDEDSSNHTKLPCLGELLVEQHHSNYGEPWAGGRDVFEFIARAASLKKSSRVLEVGCGTLRVGIHFVGYLKVGHYHCFEKDPLSLMAAFSYELPSHGLLHKRPNIVRSSEMEVELLEPGVYDVVYGSAAFLHMPVELVWRGLKKVSPRIRSKGLVFASHNIKFCTRLGWPECNRRLTELGLRYLGSATHDSLLFNHYEIWHKFEKL